MERLTKKEMLAGHEVHYVSADDCFDVWSTPKKFMGEAIDRLAAYEDTGLDPKEITELMAAHGTAILALSEYRSIGPAKHFLELAQAEKDGRLVVHGRWIINGVCPWNGVVGNWKCSKCSGISLKCSDYCPRCGAKMDLSEAALKKREDACKNESV